MKPARWEPGEGGGVVAGQLHDRSPGTGRGGRGGAQRDRLHREHVQRRGVQQHVSEKAVGKHSTRLGGADAAAR
jgi:hypothetical protein